MYIGLIIICIILTIVFFCCSDISDILILPSLLCLLVAIIMIIIGFFHGYINYPPTEGTHQGIITAVDLEGIYFRRYEIYLKSSGYTNQSDETKYLLYDYEKDLAEELQNAIGKKVKLYYGHDGGYIGWKSCGTYHIKKVEIIEEENSNELK